MRVSGKLPSFRHKKHRNSTELSQYIWTLKESNVYHFISWSTLSSRSPYNSGSKRWNLCLKEKLLIICRPELSSLNKRYELVSSCRHRSKAILRDRDLKQSGRQRQGRIRLKNEFLLLVRISNMAAGAYCLIWRHSSTSA